MKYQAIVMGASAGGIRTFGEILRQLTDDFPLPIFITQHIASDSSAQFIKLFNSKSSLKVVEAKDKAPIESGFVYIAPPGYHLLINEDYSLSLSFSECVNFSRPSIDVMFESASDVYESGLIGILLTGANRDGANGMKRIHQNGGFCIAQDPGEAEVDTMPKSAIETTKVDKVLQLSEIINFLAKL